MKDTPPLNVLMLEDSPLDAELIEEHLQRGGIAVQVKRVATKDEFIQSVYDQTFQLILADYNLPGFDGLSALKIAANKAPQTPFILVSGTLTEEAAIEAMRNGASDFVVKQRLTRLPDAVQRALNEVGEREARRIAEGLLERSNQSLSRTIETLERREEQLRLATDAAEIGMWDLDIATDTLTWSERTKAAFGMSPDASVSMDDFYTCLYADDLEATRQAFASALDPRIRATYDVEYRTVGKEDGVVRWVAAKGKGLFDSSGACIRAIGTAIDISDAKLEQARQALLAELTKLLGSDDPDAALHSACELMGRHFGVQRVGYGLLDAVADTFSYTVCWTDGTVPPLLGEYPAQAFGPQIVDKLRSGETIVVEDLFADAISSEAETLQTASDVDTRAILVVPFLRGGRLRTIVYLNARQPRKWTAGEVTFMEAVAERTRQLIERAEADAAIRGTAERYRLASKATNDPIWDWDLQTNHVLWNDALYEVFGFARTQVQPTGDWWLAQTAPDDRDRISASIHAAIDGENDHWSEEYCFLNAEGQPVPILDRGYVIRDSQGKALRMIGAMLDLTERRRAEQILRESNERLEERVAAAIAEREEVEQALRQAQKMEAVGQLTGGVAHDFNNVLQVINGNLELLKLLTAGNQPAQNRIAAAAAGVDRGAKLASHLLAFARRQPLQAVVLNAGELLQGMDELLRHSLGDLTSVQTVVADSLWNTTADPGQLENVILNLAINARDAMAGSGTVTLSARNAGPGGHTRECPEHDAGGRYVLIEVTDTGTGMPPEVLERVFEPFYTTKPAGQGTGLGLSMAYGFVKQSGGHIRLQSEVGQGTTVKVFLPCTDDSAVTEEKPAAGPVFGGIESILVVDDEPDVRETTAQLLTNLGYLALQAENADAALRILERGTHVDLVFTDVVMPGRLRSADFAQKARQLLPHLQVLFTSGYSEGILAHGGRVDPSVSLLRKPYTAEALTQKIRTLLRGREEPRPAEVQR